MRWYFASRIRHQSKIIQVAKFLEGAGEIVSSDWIYKDSLKPYEKNIERAHQVAEEVVQSLMGTDIFVLISDPEGTDIFVELGIALARKALSDDLRIYIIGEHSKRSLMQLHPNIIHLNNLREVFDLERVICHDFDTLFPSTNAPTVPLRYNSKLTNGVPPGFVIPVVRPSSFESATTTYEAASSTGK